MEPERQHATGDSATAREPSFPDAGSAPSDPRELDCLYLEADRIYYGFARRCGLSNCAYWMMYDIERADGPIALADLTSSWAYSKQTINSAIKSLEARVLLARPRRPRRHPAGRARLHPGALRRARAHGGPAGGGRPDGGPRLPGLGAYRPRALTRPAAPRRTPCHNDRANPCEGTSA